MRVLTLVRRLDRQSGRRSQSDVCGAAASIGRRRHRGRQCRKAPWADSRALRFRATLAAPPGMKLSRSNSTTGTGASGEMRPTWPQMKWSSMASPMTSARAFLAVARIRRTRAGGRVFCFMAFSLEKRSTGWSGWRFPVAHQGRFHGQAGRLPRPCGRPRPSSWDHSPRRWRC